MRHTRLSLLVVGVAAFNFSGGAFAQDDREPKDRPNAKPRETDTKKERRAEGPKREERKMRGRGEGDNRRESSPDRPADERGRNNSNDVTRKLNDSINELRRQETSLRDVLIGPDHPKLHELQEQIKMMEDKLREMSGRREEPGRLPEPNNDRRDNERRDDNRRGDERRDGDRRGGEGRNDDQFEAVARRAQHLRAAAEHLNAADARDVARQLTEKADAMERQLQEVKRRMSAESSERRAGQDRREGPDGRPGADRRGGPEGRREGPDGRGGPDGRRGPDRQNGPNRRQGFGGPSPMGSMRAEIDQLRAEIDELRKMIQSQNRKK